MKVFLCVCGFVVDICDDLAILFLMRISKNGSSLKLCSTVNFILGCKFFSRLCNSLMFPYGYF